MPISFVAAGAIATGTNPTVGLPAGIQDGDLLLLVVNVGAGATPSTPSGWTSTFSIGSNPNLFLFNRFAGGPNGPAVNIILSSSSSTTRAVILAYRGVSAINAISTAATANSTTIASNTLTTTYNNEYVVTLYGMAQGVATWTAPESTTTRVDTSGTAAETGLLVVDELLTTAGVSTTRTATSSVSKALSSRSFSLIPSGRYWVGGTNIWNSTAGTKWSFSSGGTGGAPLPAQADDVFLDANSGVSTVTIDITNTGAKSINCTGFTGTLTGSANITVSGSVTLVAGMTVTYTGTLTLAGTGTLTSAGKTLGPVTINGSGITVTLGDALNMGSSQLAIAQGTFTTANYNVTAGVLLSSNANTRTINLGSSTINLSATATDALNVATPTNLTFNAGTSQINITSAAGQASIWGSGQTFYNVSFSSATTASTSILGANTFNNLSFTAPSTAGVRVVTFNAPQTINGTFSTSGTAGNRRVWFRGVTYGLAQTLIVNSTPSLTDADFRDLYIVGTAAPISGTRIGDLRGCSGITFSAPKTVYWVNATGGDLNSNSWAASSGSSASTDNFPLAQDTAIIENTGLNVSATISSNSTMPNIGTLDMSSRTNAMTLSIASSLTVYGDWKNGSGTTISGTAALTFSGRNTQTITSAGKTFSCPINPDTFGGTVELADALNTGTQNLSITQGTFDTKNYNVTAGTLSSYNSNVREIRLGSSTLTLSSGNPIDFTTATNLTFNSGTSQINLSNSGIVNAEFGGVSYYNVTYTSTALTSVAITSAISFNNLTITSGATASLVSVGFFSSVTITGTLTVAGASPVRRIFVRSNTLGTPCTLTVGTLSATDCDFRDITIAGAAAGSSPTRAGDCGGNTGITFPAAKTVYWNLAGSQNWSATAWATQSGGTPAIENFPLPQDTAIFDDAGAAGTVNFNDNWNTGTLDASARTVAMTLGTGTNSNPIIYGNWKFGTGVTSSTSGVGSYTFAKSGVQTITSNGVTFGKSISISGPSNTNYVQLADALSLFNSSSATLFLNSGTFDAGTNNVTVFKFDTVVSTLRTLKMGSGTWTLTGTGTVWNGSANNINFYKGTANIVLSDTSTTARTFAGGGLSYNKLTIGGTTGISTLTISGNNQFTELASTKTVAHTIALGTNSQSFGKWTVTGSAGNVVTLTGTSAANFITGACTSNIDYLAIGDIRFSANSPGEFYAGVNSTANGVPAAPTYLTAKPADSTRYWVGGTGNWSDTARWSTDSGGAGGASVPRSHDDVVFNAASNATAYTATINPVTGGIRMKSLTIAGPASGNLTLTGSTAIIGLHGNMTLPATGLTNTWAGFIVLTGSTTGKIFTTNGVTLSSDLEVNGVGCEWSLGSSLTTGSGNSLGITCGGIDFGSYNFTGSAITAATSRHDRSIKLGSSTVSLATTINFSNPETFTLNAGTSQINISALQPTFSGNNQTFNNVNFTAVGAGGIVTINGQNSFNNLSFTGITSVGFKQISLTANQTVTGTLTFSAGTNATMRHWCRSDTFGTPRTITAAAVSMTDVDFRDITIAGAAAPASGTRIGDHKGNSGITFSTPKNVYCVATGSSQFTSNIWSDTSGGSANLINYPLAQDTVIFTATLPSASSTISTPAHGVFVNTFDTSSRSTGNALTIDMAANGFTFFGDLIIGSATTISLTSALMNARGRTLQKITSSGRTLAPLTVDSPGGTVRLEDAFQVSNNNNIGLTVTSGTFDANNYNVTLSSTSNGRVYTQYTTTRSINIGSGLWTIGAGTSQAWDASVSTNLTVTGTGTIRMLSSASKSFLGGGVSYTNITLDQAGAGALTITGNNTFKTITNSYKDTGATTINFGTTTQRFTGPWDARGTVGKVLTITGTSSTSPCALVYTGVGNENSPGVNYLSVIGVRAYPL